MSFTPRLPLNRPLALFASLLIHALVVMGVFFMARQHSVMMQPAQQAIQVEMIAPETQVEPSNHRAETLMEPATQPQPAPTISQPVKLPPSEIAITKPHRIKPPKKTTQNKEEKHKLQRQPVSRPSEKAAKQNPKPASVREPHPASQDKPTSAPMNGNTKQQRVSSGLPVRTTTVNPGYPARALALQIEGQVNVQFDIDDEGRLVNLQIVMAKPRNLFETEVRQALRRWRYQAGKPAKDQHVTILFHLNGGSTVQ